MATYNMDSHYTHEVDENYKEGWNEIFAKKQSYNHLYLGGDKHIDDLRYQEMMREQGHEIPDSSLFTPKINDVYLSTNPEKNQPWLNKRLAMHGLLETEEDNG